MPAVSTPFGIYQWPAMVNTCHPILLCDPGIYEKKETKMHVSPGGREEENEKKKKK